MLLSCSHDPHSALLPPTLHLQTFELQPVLSRPYSSCMSNIYLQSSPLKNFTFALTSSYRSHIKYTTGIPGEGAQGRATDFLGRNIQLSLAPFSFCFQENAVAQ
jgi:hypothetical protein